MPFSTMNTVADLTVQNILDLTYKDSVRVATATTLTIGSGVTNWTYASLHSGDGVGATLTYNTNAASSDSAHTTFFDGITLVLDDRILVKNADATKQHNGIYTCSSIGSGSSKVVLTRANDYDTASECPPGGSSFVFVTTGTANANRSFIIGTSASPADMEFGTNTFNVVSPENPATKVTVTDNESTSENNLITFVADAGDATGAHGLEMDGNFHYNPNTGTVTATAFAGPASTLSSTLAVNKGGTGLTSLALTGGVAATRVLVTNGSVMGFRNAADVCFLKGTKISLPDKSQKNIEDLKLGEFVLTYKIDGLSDLKKDDKVKIMNWSNKDMNGEFSKNRVSNIWVNPTEKYLVINDKLRITNLHIIHVKRDNEYKFLPAEKAKIGDFLFTDSGEYEPIHTIEQMNEKTEVYNIEVRKAKTYFAENYLVHHFCETCSGLAGRI